MPRRPAKREEDFLDLPTTSEMAIEDFLDEWAPQTAVVEIYRRKDDGSLPHVKRVGIEILKVDLYGYLRDKFGNGKYVLQFKDSGRKILKSLTVDVEGAALTLPNGNGVGNGGGTFHEQLILALIAGMRPAPAPAFDMGAIMQGIGTMIAALKPAPSGDPATMLAAMAATFKELKPPEDNVDKALSIISKAKELVPGGDKDDSWPGLIKEGVAAVASALKPNGQPATPARPAIPPGAEPYRPPAVQLPATTENPPVEKTSDELLMEWVTAQIGFLKIKAKAGKDVDFWIDYIFENQEEPGNAAILEVMRRGATFQHLLTFDPEIGKDPHLTAWFTKLYDALHSPEPEPVLDTPGTGGDAPNPSGDEKPSTKRRKNP